MGQPTAGQISFLGKLTAILFLYLQIRSLTESKLSFCGATQVENMASRFQESDGDGAHVTPYTVRLSRDGVVETKEFSDGVEEFEEVTAFEFELDR